MKLSGFVITAALLFAGVFAQQFNMTALNGTWHLAGLNTRSFIETKIITLLYNITISCPQVYITGNSTNETYVQPSLILGWYDNFKQQSQSANITLSGLMALENSTNATSGQFQAQLALPTVAKGFGSKQLTMLRLQQGSLTAGNSSNPLPMGADFRVSLNVTLASSKNDGNNDVVLVSFGNCSSTEYDDDNLRNHQRRDADDRTYTALLVNSANTLDNNTFANITSTLGAQNLTRLNDTCTQQQQ